MLDVERLKLTGDEQYPYMAKIVSQLVQEQTLDGRNVEGLLNAQLSKALWGLVEQLEMNGSPFIGRNATWDEACLYQQTLIKRALEAAGISRPGVPFHETITYAYGEMKYTDASQD